MFQSVCYLWFISLLEYIIIEFHYVIFINYNLLSIMLFLELSRWLRPKTVPFY